ncbi:hypothetical protein B566_EDAN007376 [Ephemera danica]|nr:hypothetical protein B566_EDAN007376 [Ephemera danica]
MKCDRPSSSSTKTPKNRPGPSNLGNVISQILLCKTITPDFNQEELNSINKDSEDIRAMLEEMQEYMPQQQDTAAHGRQLGLAGDEVLSRWSKKRRRSSLYRSMGSFCCLCKPNYL